MQSQQKFISLFNNKYREKFNDKLFDRNEDQIIDELKKVILSCQKDTEDYSIIVSGFTVIENYSEIMHIMNNFEKIHNNNKKKKRRINTYEYINLKDTDFKLLIVTYIIRDKKTTNSVDVLIQVPKIVDKYYFRIAGNYYAAIFHLLEGSTYNNATSNNPSHNLTFRTILMNLKLFKYNYMIKTYDKESVSITTFNAYVFDKSFNAYKYLLAKFGLIPTIRYLQYDSCFTITERPNESDEFYSFEKNGIYLNVPRFIYDKEVPLQAFIYCIYKNISKSTTYNDLFDIDYWIISLGSEFTTGNKKHKKGRSILNSLESNYDLKSKEILELPLKHKQDVYAVIRWMIREFSNLRIKNNLDISMKRIRFSEYIASLYSMKLSQGMFRLSDSKTTTINTIKKSILIRPTFLIESILKCNLVNCRNLVNDLDSITALKFSIKGVSGMGEKSKVAVPKVYQFIDPSHIGRLDVDSSSKTDPGSTGVLTPMCKIYDNGMFSDYKEPNTWEEEFTKTMDQYIKLSGIKQVMISKRDLLDMEIDEKRLNNIEDNLRIMKSLIRPIYRANKNTYIDVFVRKAENGGLIRYEPTGLQ